MTFTALANWTRNATSGVAEHQARIPDELVSALELLVDESRLTFRSVLLAAHAKVLSALSGDREVASGVVIAEGRPPLLGRMTTEPRTWRALLREAQRADAALRTNTDAQVDDRHGDPTLTTFDTVINPSPGAGGDLVGNAALYVTIREDEGLLLRLRYSTETIDERHAARIAGYYLTALASIAADPDGEHERQTLLSPAERQFQVEHLAGPRRRLPDRRVHELFEQQVRACPDAIAAVHRGTAWTYSQLNGRANRLARALLARGLRKEDAVAVVIERNLDWMATVLAIFKAGGAYLPIEPHAPADRIARTLFRADCRLVVTERASTATLDEALASMPGVGALLIETAYDEDHADDDVGVCVASDQLAYIYFTSGSTGEPKGAMCEHLGMLNHLFAKIDDFGIGAGDVVAQTAPLCFDISLWQLVSALLVGGRTLLVEQEAIMDAKPFVDRIVEGRAAVIQVVPSYLEVLLACLEQHPRELPDLRCVSVTGEALKKELTARWFAAMPQITLVNAYGLTETSDDTNHEIMDRVPDRERVPLGRPINNVHVYIVDEQLSLVPLGAPGEIVFSGVCVGRGYINDPERTRRAFISDPHREGERLYRSGDYGRWLPDGKLEFLGRRDAQIKINGLRIEIGEIEHTLLRVPGVRDAAVVVVERADRRRHLAAFHVGAQPVDADVLRDHLAGSLPEYMVPSVFHWRSTLPLTDHGKVDRKALTALAEQWDVAEDGHDLPSTATEQRVAAAWAEVLGIPKQQIGHHSHFFELGGTSLSTVQLAVALGRVVSFKELTSHPILSDLAALIDGASDRPPGGDPHPSRIGSVSSSSSIDIDVQPGKPPLLRVVASGDTLGWVAEHRDAVRAAVVEHGSLLIRGLELGDVAETAVVLRQFGSLMSEKEAFAPRECYADGVYSSSVWPRKEPMCMHHELSYACECPSLMLFACLVAPAGEGATPLADSPTTLRALPTELVERFERVGWLLIRNYNTDLTASLAEAFGTDDRLAVESYCQANAIRFEWQPGGGLRTWQRRSAVVNHPLTGQRCWFNQIAFLSEWTFEPKVRRYLLDVCGEDGLPFNTRFGDGEAIGPEIVQTINAAYEANTAREPWQAGDLMLVDNIRTAHGRERFAGPRQIVVAMADAMHLAAPAAVAV